MRRLFSNIWLWSAVAVLIISVNLYVSIANEEPQWFQKCGSLIVIIGIIVTARRKIRLGDEHRNIDLNYPDETPEGKRTLLDERAQYIIGPVIAFIGTIVWGYGDVILRWLVF